jgi:glycosyltransferase involved in cell wall biosynthesis
MRVSIIIPVYKAERYIKRCVDSVLCQTYTDLEIILVDDGSPDSSGRICDQYAGRDGRIYVLHQHNKGIGAARNSGMRMATGTYLFFLDADDYIDPRTIELLCSKALKTTTDIVIGNVTTLYGNQTVTKLPVFEWSTLSSEDLKNPEIRYKLFYSPGYAITAWNKLYRTDFLRDSKLTFEEKNVFYEDRLFNTKCFVNSPSIQFVNEYTYFYCTYASIVTKSKIPIPVEQSVGILIDLREYFERIGVLADNHDLLAWVTLGMISQVARNIFLHETYKFGSIRKFLIEYKKSEVVQYYIKQLSQGKYLEVSVRKYWKKYARGLSYLYNGNAYTTIALLLYLRFIFQIKKEVYR